MNNDVIKLYTIDADGNEVCELHHAHQGDLEYPTIWSSAWERAYGDKSNPPLSLHVGSVIPINRDGNEPSQP